jgi:hypothetical protein
VLRSISIITAAIALAVALPVSAGAQQDLRNPDNRDTGTAAGTQDLRNPDNRNPEPGPGSQDLRSPDAVDASRHAGIYAIDPAGGGSPIEPSVTGFQWGAAGIGAAATLGLICLAGGGALVAVTLRRRRSLAA